MQASRDEARLLEAHTFPVDQAVSLVVSLAQAAEALRSWSENPSSIRKIMVNIDWCSCRLSLNRVIAARPGIAARIEPAEFDDASAVEASAPIYSKTVSSGVPFL